MDGCLPNLIKYLLFATNFLVFVMGCVALGIGIYALVDGQALVDLVENSSDLTLNVYTTAAILFIVVSVMVVIVTFFGCCGAIKESKCMLGTYFTFILVMFIILIVGAVIGYSQAADQIKDPLKKSMEKYKINAESKEEQAIQQAWDGLQEDFQCCGIDAYGDWKDNCPDFPDSSANLVPKSCCSNKATNSIPDCQKNPNKYNLTGCYTKFKEGFDKNKDLILAIGVTIVVIMFLNMLFAFAMCTMAR